MKWSKSKLNKEEKLTFDDMYKYIAGGGRIADYRGVTPAAVLSSGTKDVEAKYDADPDKVGFQAPSGITIRVKSKRPIK